MLFSTKELERKESAEAMLPHPERCATYFNEATEADLEKALPKIEHNYSYHFATELRWHLHDIVVHIVKIIGPCEMYFSTYAIKEFQARLYTGMKADGLISSLHVLLDYRIPVHDAAADQLLRSQADSIGYMRTHSKLTVLIGKELSAVITGSANHTTNTTSDVGVITCVEEVATARKKWIIENIRHATK